MRCPASDPGFADHPIHGQAAQLPEIRKAVSLCRSTCGTAVDVGAHIGIWSVELAKHFSRVQAFEPVEENYLCLCDNTLGKPVTWWNVALGDREGFCEMCSPTSGNSGMAYASHDLYEGGGRVTTKALHTLDSYGFSDVGLIKIDVEGYEGRVLMGALRTVIASQPVVVFEDNGLGPKRYGRDWIDPKPILRELLYKKALRIRKDEIWVPSP